jgi:hypothetical protein
MKKRDIQGTRERAFSMMLKTFSSRSKNIIFLAQTNASMVSRPL